MELYSVFVTGANKGIGLELVRQLVCLPKPPAYIFATYRSEDTVKALQEIKDSSKNSQVLLIKMDVTKGSEIQAARKTVQDVVGQNGLTLLINNAGVLEPQAFPKITEENLLLHFRTNTVAPVMVFQEMLPLLQKAASRNTHPGMRVSKAAVLNISAMIGSIERTGRVNLQDLFFPGYKTSKAGLNMALRVISANVKDQGILVVMVTPGWVKTDMGTSKADLTTEESVTAMLKTLETLNDEHHGTFMDRFGNPYPF